jgi:hypothetical protein
MDEKEIVQKRKEGKYVIKAAGPSRIKGNPFLTPFPHMERDCAFAVLDSYRSSDLPQIKKFAAERLNCPEEKVEIEVFEPFS